jgi:predicted Rossmann fold flavoprotein
VEPRAGLVPLVFSVGDKQQWCDLAGVAFEVVARAEGEVQSRKKVPAFRERLLVTHRGLSGPAVLQASSYWRPGGEVSFDIAPGLEVFAPLLAQASGRDWNSAYAALRTVLPTRMAERWVRVRANASAGDWTNAGIARLERALHAWTLRPDGSEGFAKAEVTVGGVDTAELDARTMESKRAQGLDFIGEVVDVTGWLGGYNFQWAWASAGAAGAAA